MSTEPDDLFRQEALDHYAAGPGREGHVLRIRPSWTTWCFWLVLVSVLALFVYLVFGRLHRYARGIGVVRVEGRTLVTAAHEGTIVALPIRSGQGVVAGEMLIQLDDARERAELERIDKELELQTRRLLMDLVDDVARRALTVLRAQHQQADASLETRRIRAPHAGIISDLRIHVGQQLQTGQPILSLVPPDAEFRVVAILPGDCRPMVTVGDAMRLELSGYHYVYQRLRVDSVGDQVIGPQEAARYLGADVADALMLQGPVVLVQAPIPRRTFFAEGREYEYYDGLVGTVQLRLESESILVSLVPGLKSLFREVHD